MRILIVDDHALFREGVARLLQGVPQLEVVGAVATVQAALDLLPAAKPTIVLLDYDLGFERGLSFVTRARDMGFSGSVLVVTAGVSDEEAVQLIHNGVAGVFHKHNSPETLCACVQHIAGGDVWLEQKYLKPLFRSADQSSDSTARPFTERERHVLRGVFQGLANKEIAERLELSESSVKGTLQQLFEKTGVRTRSQLVRVALEQFRDQL